MREQTDAVLLGLRGFFRFEFLDAVDRCGQLLS